MSAALVIIPAAGVLALASSGEIAAPAQTNTTPTGGVRLATPSRSSTIADALKGGSEVGTAPSRIPGAALKRLASIGVRSAGDAQGVVAVDPTVQQIFDTIDTYGKAAYDQMSKDAKKAGAKAMSEALGLDPPMTGDEDWETIAKIAGGAAGVAAFGWLPGGAVWGPIVGAYFGVKLEEFLSGNVDDVKDWFKSRWSDIESWVSDTVGDARDAVGDFFSDIF